MAVNIPLDSRYAISSDKHQWILFQDNRPFWFFQNLENLLNEYLRLKIKGSDIKTIQELIEYQKTQQEALCRVLTSIQIQDELKVLVSGGGK